MVSKRTEGIIFFLFAATSFLYLVLRAINAGTINDEAVTFFQFIHVEKFIPFAPSTHLSVNNHVLNSLLAWLSYKAFGVSEWVIRLPNLLAFLVYMWYIYRLGNYLSRTYLKFLFWILLTGAHYYLEFFAYSRGYGLGLALLAGSVYFLIRADQKGKNTSIDLGLGLLYIFLATMANLNLLVPFLIWNCLAIKHLLLRAGNKKPLLYFSIVGILLGAIIIFWSLKLRGNEPSLFGETSLTGSFHSLIHFFTDYTANEISWVYLLVLTFVVLAGGYWLIKNRSFKITALSGFYVFFLLSVLGRVVLHYVQGVNYPLERTGFHWYFFMAGSIPFIIDQFRTSLKLPLATIIFLTFVPVFAFTAQSLSFYSSSDFLWRRQQISDDFFHLTKQLNEDKEHPLSMYAPENFYTVNMAFKNLKYSGNLNVCNSFHPNEKAYSADLLIIDTARYPECLLAYEEIYYDKHSTMSLMKRNPPLKAILVADTFFTSLISTDLEFTSLGSFMIADKHDENSYRVDFDLSLTSPENPLKSVVTVEVRDSSAHVISYDQVSLDYFQTNFSEGYEQKLNVVLNNLPAKARYVRCYLWNLEKKELNIKRAEIILSKLVKNSNPQY